MQYKLVEKANPLKKDDKKWYANPIATRKVGQKELAKEIELQSSLTKGDIGNVIDNLVENLPKHLVNGESVQLGEFGTFRISFSSEGVVDKSKFNTKTIQPKVIFTPSVAFKKALEDIQYSTKDGNNKKHYFAPSQSCLRQVTHSFCSFWCWQKHHRSMVNEGTSRIEVGFLHQLYYSCTTWYRAEWCGIYLPLTRRVQREDS